MKEKHFNLLMLMVIVGGVMAIPTVRKNNLQLAYNDQGETIGPVLPEEITGRAMGRIGQVALPVIGGVILYELYKACKEDNDKWSNGRS